MSSNDAIIQSMASAIFDKMMEDVLLDVAQKAHRESHRSRTVCSVCHTRCRSTHPPTLGLSSSQVSLNHLAAPTQEGSSSSSRPPSPSPGSQPKSQGTSTPNGKSGSDVLLDCLNCKRPIASNRYAPHLASCLGIPTGARRAVARNAVNKTKLSADGSRAGTPVPINQDDAPAPPPVRKGRPPKGSAPRGPKKKGSQSATPELNSSGKRPASPSSTPPKNKKAKAGTASPSVSSKTLPPLSASHRASFPKVPSRLGASSISSSTYPVSLSGSSPISGKMDLDRDSPSSQHSSPGGTPESMSVSGGGGGTRGSKTVPGKTAPPGYPMPRPAVSMSVTSHNDPDYAGADADDLADTDSGSDDNGDDD